VKSFRCTNPKCQAKSEGKFLSEKPTCPQCKIGAEHERFGNLIVRLVEVHFDPPSEVPGFGLGVRACDRSKPIQAEMGGNGMPNPFHAGTGVLRAVTCEKCKKSAAFLNAMMSEEDDARGVAEAAFSRLAMGAPV